MADFVPRDRLLQKAYWIELESIWEYGPLNQPITAHVVPEGKNKYH